MEFETRWGEKVLQILHAYGNTAHAAKAVEILIKTAEEHGFKKGRDAAAETVCEGLHKDPPAGILCKRCVDAESSAIEEIAVIAEKEEADEAD